MVQTPAFEAALALSRFGLGSGTDGVAAINGDVRDLLHAEISAGAPVVTHANLLSSPELLVEVYQYQKDKAVERKAAQPSGMTDTMQGGVPDASQNGAMTDMQAAAKPKKNKSDLDNPIKPAIFTELDARFNGTIRSPRIGFNERMVMFWANHFAVSVKKSQPVAAITGAYEREAIRPHVFGRFEDMLLAVETHPCMLLYLDNAQSVGPNSAAGRSGTSYGADQGTKRGLNENLAREILELHTLGVGSGYTQADVTSFAKVITGWSVSRQPRQGTPGAFTFNDRAHEPGPQTILGKTYNDRGMDQGKAVLADLVRHPATAQHIATKLARHFVADDPPPALVARLAETFRRTGGDLGEVSRTLLASEEAWAPQLVKMRSPLEYVCAILRATGATLKAQAITVSLNAMGQPFWQPGGPNGFPDTVAAWASPEGIATRMDFANALANAADPGVDPRAFAESRLGALMSDHTREAIARAETHTQGLGLVFLSPEFMRR